MRHRIQSAVRVRVSVLPNGRPFAVAADQTLVVTVPGDYFLTIGAPLLGVEALPGSGATPGLRSTSIVWEGFNPGHHTLKARARLVASRAAPALPLRIEVQKGLTTFVNTTGVTVDAFAADADPAPLVDYLTRLEHAVAAGGPLLREPRASRATPTRRAFTSWCLCSSAVPSAAGRSPRA